MGAALRLPLHPATRGGVQVEFLGLDGLSMAAVTAAMEPLAKANLVLGHAAFGWRLVSPMGGALRSQEGWDIACETRLGGADVTLVCGDATAPQVQDHLRRQWRMGRFVGALGAGVFTLARAGILRGHRIALHWTDAPAFLAEWPDAELCEGAFCIDRRIMTCAGPLAAADMMLHLLEDRLGAALVQEVMDLCLIRTRRPQAEAQTTSLGPRLRSRNPNLLRAVSWIDTHYLDAFCLESCAEAAGVSARQLQRLFQRYVGKSPLQYLIERRMDHARRLLTDTDLAVREVSEACGFSSVANFSKGFRKTFGIAPSRVASLSF